MNTAIRILTPSIGNAQPSFRPAQSGLLQRKCACGNHTMAGGECAGCAKNKSGLQRKLAIGASHDPLELEADRVADQVMAASTHSAVSGALLHIQRFAGQSVTMPLIFEAARSEFLKLEKPVNETEFRLMQAVEAKA